MRPRLSGGSTITAFQRISTYLLGGDCDKGCERALTHTQITHARIIRTHAIECQIQLATDRMSHTYTQHMHTDRHTDTQTHRYTDTQTHGHTDAHTNICA